MSVQATTHLNFRGNAREALAFYHSVFGGTVALVTNQQAGKVQRPEEADQLMWGQVAADSGFRIMAYDVPSETSYHQGENAFLIAVEAGTPDEVKTYWEKLSADANIEQPLTPSPWSPLYGMLKDRFGVNWVLSVAAPQ